MTQNLEKQIKEFLNTNFSLLDNEIPKVQVEQNNLKLIIANKKVNLIELEDQLKEHFSIIQNISVIFTKERETQNNISITKNIKKIILVASCKGGVGKSSCAKLIAKNYVAKYKVGLLDADIYGPSLPSLFETNQQLEINNNKIEPIIAENIKLMSIGYLLQEKAAIWRGPMLTKTLNQLLLGVNWGELDYLFIDMPPGTGDIYIKLLGNFNISAAILVTTPHNLAIKDLEKTIDLFKRYNLKISGVIENMSYYQYNDQKLKIFGESPEYFYEKYKLPLLAKLPIIPQNEFMKIELSIIDK